MKRGGEKGEEEEQAENFEGGDGRWRRRKEDEKK
jgi:hypothetical protein